MATPEVGISLEIRKLVAAAPDRIFDAWTTPDILTRWFAPTPDHAVIVHRADCRPGGQYRIEMRHVNGASHIAVGEYGDVSRPTRLAFTWKWEGTAMADTLVTVEFRASGEGTEVVLTHARFATDAEREGHLKGWAGCLGRLEPATAG